MAGQVALQNLEWYSGVPRSIRKQSIIGIGLIILTFGGFGSWAAFAPLAAAVIAPGSFVATGENKIVQHFEGGIVKDMLVREGDKVTVGQEMVLLDETAARANAQQLQLRMVRLETIWARLNGEAKGDLIYSPPPAVLKLLSDPEVALINASQRNNFEASRDKLLNEIELMEQNVVTLQYRITGREEQVASMERQMLLLEEDRDVITDLQKKGVTTRSAVRNAERAIADGEGDIARLRSEISEAQSQMIKYKREIIQARDAAQQAALDEMQGVESELDSVREQILQANNVLQRTSITAPVSGTIVRMFYHTTGGVIESGKPIMEILPADVPLIVEVKIPRLQIDEVRKGQQATVRLTALNQRTTPVLTGEVIYVSADTIADPGSAAQEIYVARVNIDPSQLQRVENFTPTPGMPAEVFVQTRERTFFEYLTKPIVDSMSRAFHER
ncbi:HlyD family type I secretion periplasmic adaptor subunit [Devosia rhodophyticola]|uniref:Membrane fusion protein (MFP) family protein n=1 Tax=Devosia rhodophyticola TaxID=3026423 RepID=A0ABY7YY06_9HYPH|nr:HlyD family type I secretion periplasmic adaptor subunit [Devosia rhodophyticola]WDR06124.1 HlyD family type I secretion periplasmic adaptor subunit [Devosia rhodophyticola]